MEHYRVAEGVTKARHAPRGTRRQNRNDERYQQGNNNKSSSNANNKFSYRFLSYVIHNWSAITALAPV
jgi:hypothetical protein